jgi:2-oxoglutarate ferredoxin oxidoreductase subunit alpha
LDVLIALDEQTIILHKDELNPDAVVLADSFEADDISRLGANAVVVPMSSSSKVLEAPPITRNSVALGATCYLLDLHFPQMQDVLRQVFRERRLEVNIRLADIGFEHMQKLNFRHSRNLTPGQHTKDLVDGNMAFGKGLEAAGLNFYIAYPMTPATGILHYLALKQKDSGVRVIQPESELTVINMALGVAYAGKRVAIGSATGGFALMQEALSFSGIAEIPLVVAISQRQGPATGVPTYSSQSDLRMVIHSGHGEFPRIVIAPGDADESFTAGVDALNLAWRYQMPVLVLLDKLLSEHSVTMQIPTGVPIDRGLMAENVSEQYGRFAITGDGISPMAFPGTSNAVVKTTSYEHDENGITAEEALPVKAMIDKRFVKTETLLKELDRRETIKVYGDKESKNVIVFWGSTKGAMLEAAKYFTKPVKLVQILWVEPFDSKRVTEELKGAERIINVECNHDGQMASLLREKTGIVVTQSILKYDSRPLEPMELAAQINSIING